MALSASGATWSWELAGNDRATVLGSTLSASGATVVGLALSASGAALLVFALSARALRGGLRCEGRGLL